MTDADGFFNQRNLPQVMVEDPTQDPDKLAPENTEDDFNVDAYSAPGEPSSAHGGGSSSQRVGVDESIMGMEIMEPSPPYTFADYVGHRQQLQQQQLIQQHQAMAQLPEQVPLMLPQQLPQQVIPIQALHQIPQAAPDVPMIVPPQATPSAPHILLQMPPQRPPQSMSDNAGGVPNGPATTIPVTCDCGAEQEGCDHHRWHRRFRQRGRTGEDEWRRWEKKRKYRRGIRKAFCFIIGFLFIFLVLWQGYDIVLEHWNKALKKIKEDTDESYVCTYAPYSFRAKTSFEFPASSSNASLYLHQYAMRKSNPWQEKAEFHYEGKVKIMGYDPTEDDVDANPIKFNFHIRMSKPEMRDMIRVEMGDDGEGVVLYTDYSHRQMLKPSGCATIHATISIPRGRIGTSSVPRVPPVLLSNLDISVETLCIEIDATSLDLTVSDKTSLQSICGGITFSGSLLSDITERSRFFPTAVNSGVGSDLSQGFRTHSFHAKTQKGAIIALPLPLFDNLNVETTSGNIKLNFDAPSEAISDLTPAVINVQSLSGTVNIESAPPAGNRAEIRGTSTSIITTSGSVSGSLVLPPTGELSITSFSGDISPLEVFVPSSPQQVKITTDTKTGDTSVRMLETGGGELDAVTALEKVIVKGKHDSFSGNIEVVYPQRWEGSIMGRNLDGNIDLRGEGVRIVSEEGKETKKRNLYTNDNEEEEENDQKTVTLELPPVSSGLWKTIRAIKGNPEEPNQGDVKISSVSGDVDFLVGVRRKSWVEEGRQRLERIKNWLKNSTKGCQKLKEIVEENVIESVEDTTNEEGLKDRESVRKPV